MAKQASIKEIAMKAGVSPGTVDRIIHNRGNVSEKRRIAVEKALEEAGYKTNIHTSAVSFRKTITLAVTCPVAFPGGYWESVGKGFNEALDEFSDIDLRVIEFPYDQFDTDSCKETFEALLNAEELDAVIIGPTFKEPTQEFCAELDRRGIPYVFVDTDIRGTSPWAVFISDQSACGRIVGRLLDAGNGEIAIMETRRRGCKQAYNDNERERGLLDFLESKGNGAKPKKCLFSSTDAELAEREISEFLNENREIQCLTVLNASGHIVADILKKNGREDIRLVCFDMTTDNRRCLEEGTIHSLICQRPAALGYCAIHYLVNYFIYKVGKNEKTTLMPIDVVFKESLPCYRESSRYYEN